MFLAFKAVAWLEAGRALEFAWTLQKNNLICAVLYSCLGVMQIIHDENCIRLNDHVSFEQDFFAVLRWCSDEAFSDSFA